MCVAHHSLLAVRRNAAEVVNSRLVFDGDRELEARVLHGALEGAGLLRRVADAQGGRLRDGVRLWGRVPGSQQSRKPPIRRRRMLLLCRIGLTPAPQMKETFCPGLTLMLNGTKRWHSRRTSTSAVTTSAGVRRSSQDCAQTHQIALLWSDDDLSRSRDQTRVVVARRGDRGGGPPGAVGHARHSGHAHRVGHAGAWRQRLGDGSVGFIGS